MYISTMKFSELDLTKLSIEEKYELVMHGVTDYGKRKAKEKEKVDFLIVLGCTPRPLKARVVKAAELYKRGYTDYILLSGGHGWNRNVEKNSDRDKYLLDRAREAIETEALEGYEDEDIRELTESELMSKMIKFLDVPEDKLFYEPFSNTTLENIKATKYIFRGIEDRGEVDSINSVMLVTSSFHCRRAILTYRRIFVGFDISACPATMDFGEAGFSKETILNSDYYKKQIENELAAIVNYTRNGSIEDCDISEFVGKKIAKHIENKMIEKDIR